MAGTLAKFPYQNIGNNNINASHMNRPGAVGNMEENEIIDYLKDQSFNKRAEILEQLRISVRKNGGRLVYVDRKAIFRGLGDALGDSNWDVRHQCVQLINEVIPHFGDDLDACMNIVLPKLIPNVGDTKITIRKSVIQTLHVYMKYTSDIQQLFRAIVSHGLESDDQKVRRDTVIALPMLFTPEFSQEDLFIITESLTKRLVDASSSSDASLMQHCILSMRKIKHLVGQESYDGYLRRMSAPLRNYHNQIMVEDERHGAVQQSRDFRSNPSTPGSITTSQYDTWTGGNQFDRDNRFSPDYRRSTKPLEFGVVPGEIMDDLNDQTNFKTRAQGVEALRNIIGELKDAKPLISHMLQFVSFLNNLLDDPHFKITTVTLEILGMLVTKTGKQIEPHLKAVVLALSKRMGDNKIVVRQAIVKVVMQLMQILNPKAVLAVVTEQLTHRNSKVRQETLNIVIAALLTFPSYDFDLGTLCEIIAPTLLDHKRQVRQAALECFAVLAQAMGAGRLAPLVHAVDAVELSQDGDGVMAAVQARLAKRQLPRFSSDGLIEYATNMPSSATTRGSSGMAMGADIDWIMAASSGAGSSARSVRSELDLVSVVSSARSTPDNFVTDMGPTPRRHMSASKGKGKLPWEDDDFAQHNGVTDARTETHQALRSRPTWADQTNNQDFMRSRGISRENSPDPGSYVGIHRNHQRMRRQTSESPGQPFALVADDDEDMNPALTSRSEKMTFSQSWPEPRMFEDAKLTKKKLDPIAATGSNGQNQLDSSSQESLSRTPEKSPVPTRPALARNTSSKRKVPPISSRITYDELDFGADDIDGGPDLVDEDEDSEMLRSLHKIRNSASKKKAQMFADSDGLPSPDSPSSQNMPSDVDSAKTGQRRKAENPFEAKPRLARKSSLRELNRKIESNEANHLDFNPNGGVTFRDNPASDVAIVGKGYGEGINQVEPKPSTQSLKGKNKRTNKSILSPLGTTSSYTALAWDADFDGLYHPVIGKGVFENNQENLSSGGPNPKLDRRLSGANPEDFPKGVYGKSVNKQGSQDDEDEEDSGSLSMSMSRVTRERLEQKQAKSLEAAAEKKKKDEEFAYERELEKEREREKRQEKLRRISSQRQMSPPPEEKIRGLTISGNSGNTNGNGANNGFATSPTSDKPPSGAATVHSVPTKPPIKKKVSRISTMDGENGSLSTTPSGNVPLSSQPSSSELENWENLQPFKEPNSALVEALRFLAMEEWETKNSGLNHVRRLCKHHPDVLLPQLSTVNVAVVQEIKNLRSQVSRLAIAAMGDLYCTMRKNMDTDLDKTVRALLVKSGESNKFIQSDVENSLESMIENVTLLRGMLALIAEAGHRNATIRRVVSQALVNIVERMGPGKVLSGVKDLTDKILPCAAQLVTDPSPETRYNGQKIMYTLMSHEDFDKMLAKYVSASVQRNIQDKLDTLRRKGLNETTSARSRRSGHGSRSSSATRGGSASSSVSDAPSKASSTPSSKRRSAPRMDDNTAEEIKTLCALMGANDWRERHRGIVQLQSMTVTNANVIGNNVPKIFDKFVPCLKDSNVKVNLYALQTMNEIIPALKDSLSSVMALTVATVASNLSSKNKDIYDAASVILDNLMECMDPACLIQPFVNVASNANTRIKPDMVERVAYLSSVVYSRKPKAVIMHVLPLLWNLLAGLSGSGTATGSVGLRSACSKLAFSLQACMGPSLMEHASSNSNVTPKMKQLLQDMLDNGA